MLRRNLLKSLMALIPIHFISKNKDGVVEAACSKNGYWKKVVYDENDNELAYEDSDGRWGRNSYDKNGNFLSCEDYTGFWNKSTYDENNNMLTYSDCTGCWFEKTFDENGKQTSIKSSLKI